MAKLPAITPKQKRFVEEYLVDLNGTKAAIRAGYSRRTADGQASRLLKTPHVAEAVQKAMDARSERTEITQDFVLRQLYWILVANPDHFDAAARVKPGAPPQVINAMAGVKRKILQSGEDTKLVSAEFRLWDKTRALSLAMRHLGMLNDKMELDIGEELRKLLESASGDFDRGIAGIAARLKESEVPQ